MRIDFNQARSKHMFFKTRVRGYLLGSDANSENFKTYLTELGDWVTSLASNYQLHMDEVMEANYLHNELADQTDKLIALWTRGKEEEAKNKFREIEATGEQFLHTLTSLENRINQ